MVAEVSKKCGALFSPYTADADELKAFASSHGTCLRTQVEA